MSDAETISNFDKLSEVIDTILLTSPSTEIAIAGDFNVHNVQWLRYSSITSSAGRHVELFCESYNLRQLVDCPTRIPDVAGQSANLLDLFLTSHPDKYKTSVTSPLGNSDHCLISAQFYTSSLETCSSSAMRRLVWHYKQADWASLNRFFREINWTDCFAFRDVNHCSTMITDIIWFGMSAFIPHSYKKLNQNNTSWFNEECRIAMRGKDVAFRNYKNNICPETRRVYKLARNHCTSTIRGAKFQFDQEIRRKVFASQKGDKGFWSLVKTVKNNFTSSSIPPLVHSGTTYTQSLDKANLLAANFAASSYLTPTSQEPPSLLPCNCNQGPLHFRTREVFKVLAKLNVAKAAGPDGISPLVLKCCASSLAKPLRKLFHLSYSTGIFPSAWKIAHVQPIPKKGEACDPSNYRPIAITSILSKVFETLINTQLMRYLESNHLISDRQYGFRAGRSTGDLMTFLTERWNHCLHNFGESEIVALDISKAFDRVWHPALLAKLKAFGLDPQLLKWIGSFLSNRSISVILDGCISTPHEVNAGVPQGSVLSPTLFLIFINDLLSITSNPIHSFADDSTLDFAYSFGSVADSRGNATDVNRNRMIRSLNEDIERILAWGKANRVLFNSSKTQCCLVSLKRSTIPLQPITVDGVNISNVPALNVLGIHISSNLSWTDHIFSIAKNAMKCLGFLHRCKKYFTPSDLALIYKTHIRPRLEYNSHLFSGAGHTALSALDKVQRKAFKLIGDETITSSIDSLEHRRNVGCLSLFYRYFHGHCSDEISSLIPCRVIPVRNTRASNTAHPYTLQTRFGRTVKYRDSFLSRTVRMWNRLPSSVFPTGYELQKFRRNVHRHLLQSPT